MSVREYIGARYVPIFATPYEWDKTKTYEPLTIVYYSGNSYTSRQYVPADTDILNENYWALTGNYNSQIEQYRKDVKQVITDLATEETTRANADTTLQTNIDNESKTRANADTTLQTNINILSSYVYNLSDFEGNTSEEKFKKAMSTLTNGTIIGTKISITSPFDVASTSTDYRTLILNGFSFDCSSSNIFTSSKPDSSLAVDNSVPQFINSDFTNGTIYDDFNVISPTFTACVFNNSSIINSTTKFIQSPYFSQCQILKTTKDFINTNNVYNAIFTNTKIESSLS